MHIMRKSVVCVQCARHSDDVGYFVVMILFPLSISILDAHATIENHIELRIKLVATVDTMIVEFLDAVLHMHRVRIMTADYVLVAVLFAYHGSRPMHQSNRTKAIVHASENMNTAFKSYAH